MDDHRMPTRFSNALFRLKSFILQLQRGARNRGQGICSFEKGEAEKYPHLLAVGKFPLWSTEDEKEIALHFGKVQNLRCALRAIDGITIPANATFSFWKQIGRATARRGYAVGRELREGCIIPSIGGGLCLLSNALYDCALKSGFEIVERHAHSRAVPGSAAEAGRDATVFWNYVDLRFRPGQSVYLHAYLTHTEIVIEFWGENPAENRAPIELRVFKPSPNLEVSSHNCNECGVEACFRHAPNGSSQSSVGRTAYLLDECWPEYRDYLKRVRTSQDLLFLPLNGKRWNRPNYAWEVDGYATVFSAPWSTLSRALQSRTLGTYGAKRLQAQIDAARHLANSFARRLPPEVTHICVSQTLLPFLWEWGHLGARTFDVLMTRLPLQVLHERLDKCLAQYPERTTLGEFRAPHSLVRAETEALRVAGRIISPHSEVRSLFAERAVFLQWRMPSVKNGIRGKKVLFPGPTAARKGAYELRNVLRRLGLEVIVIASDLEGPDFWQGMRATTLLRGNPFPIEAVEADAGVVVQPALVEDKPRALLRAIAARIPVIATNACGLADVDSVIKVPFGDEDALGEAIARALRI